MAQLAEDECGICLDALANPVELPCSHKFCSKCLESWRSKYGSQGDREKIGRACPFCREKIPPSKEMLTQLKFFRGLKKEAEAEGDTSSGDYSFVVAKIEELEQEIGDWTEPLQDVGEESLELPHSIFEATVNGDVQKVLDWLGAPPVDKKRINAKCAEVMGCTLIHGAALPELDHVGLVEVCKNFLGILLQFGADVNAVSARGHSAVRLAIDPEYFPLARLLLEWGAEIDPQQFGRTTKGDVVSLVLREGNAKLANLLKSELGGRRCELVNFTTRPELNGKTCVVEKHLPNKDRYKIVFEGSGEKAFVPPLNLKRRDRTPTDCGYYISFENGRYCRRDFASKEECQAYVAEVEAKHATERPEADWARTCWQRPKGDGQAQQLGGGEQGRGPEEDACCQ